MCDKQQITEEPCEGKLSSTVLESSGSREGVTDFNLTKFLKFYGLSSDTAAALVLARRALYKSERLPARYARFLPEDRHRHAWSYWRVLLPETIKF